MDLLLDFNDTHVRTMLVPALTAFATIGLLRFFLGSWLGSITATIGIGSGFVVAYLLTDFLPAWPPGTPLSILPYLVGAAIVVGLLLDLGNWGASTLNMIFLGTSIGVVFWVGTAWNGGVIDQGALALYGILIFSGYWAMHRMEEHRDEGLAAPIAVIGASAALAVIGHLYGTRTGLFATALAFSTLGYVMWNWPKCRLPWGATGTLITGGAYLVLASELAIKNPGLALPVGASLISFVVYDVTSRLFPLPPAMQPIAQLAVSTGPAALAAYLMP